MDGLQPGQRVHLDALAAKVDAINAKTLDTLEKYGLMDKASMDAWRNTYQHYVPLHRDEAHPDAVSHPIGQGFSTQGCSQQAPHWLQREGDKHPSAHCDAARVGPDPRGKEPRGQEAVSDGSPKP